jgi:hypothetical protein
MNRLSLVISETCTGDGEQYRGIQIFVDGQNFREVVRSHEEPFAARENNPQLAGDYHWLDAAFTTPEVFLGTAEREYGIDENKVALMGCSCGVVSCWPLVCIVTCTEDTVVRDDFEQPFRSTDSVVGHWDLSGLGPFTFDRTEYMTMLNQLKKGG